MPPIGDVLQYGALGLLAAVLWGTYRIGSRVGDAAINTLRDVAVTLDTMRERMAVHDTDDAGRHEATQALIKSETNRAISARR